MPIVSYCLAGDENEEWRLAFEADELHLYIQHSRDGILVTPPGYMTLEDFLVHIPQGSLHRQAHERFVALLARFIRNCGHNGASMT